MFGLITPMNTWWTDSEALKKNPATHVLMMQYLSKQNYILREG